MLRQDSAVLQTPASIFAVVVIYRLLPMESPGVRSLIAAARATEASELRVRLRIADNTPGGQVVGALPQGFEYCAYPANPGLVQPYNDALAAAEAEGFQWLLVLDQDTDLPMDFLTRVTAEAQRYANNPEVAAIVPSIVDSGRLISPLCFRGGFLPMVLRAGVHGLAPRHVSAINSGSLLRCEALRSAGGYDPDFPLHNSDTRLYQKLNQAGYRVAIANVTVPHELSILKREQRISPERYRKMLVDECLYWDRHMSAPARAERIVRLAGRFVRGVLTKEDAIFRSITGNELRRRIFTSRIARINRKL